MIFFWIFFFFVIVKFLKWNLQRIKTILESGKHFRWLQLMSCCSAKRTSLKSPFLRRPLSQHRFFSCCACFNVRHLLCGITGRRNRFSFLSKPHPHKEWGSMRRSCGMPDLIHIKNESHLGMDGTRGDGSRGPLGPAPCCLDGNPPQEYPGMSRNRVILSIRMSISR